MTRSARPDFSIDPAVFYPALVLLALGVLAVVTMPGDGAALFADLQAVYCCRGKLVLCAGHCPYGRDGAGVIGFSLRRYQVGPGSCRTRLWILILVLYAFRRRCRCRAVVLRGRRAGIALFIASGWRGRHEAAAAGGMQLTYLHWGFNAWATYAAVAMVLAYFSYRHNLPLTLRSAFYPLIGDRIYGPMGASVDVFAVICTTCGISVSLGLGVLQINTGLNYLFGVAIDAWIQVLLIFATMAVATVSVIMGLDSGIKRLSEINTVLAVSLLL